MRTYVQNKVQQFHGMDKLVIGYAIAGGIIGLFIAAHWLGFPKTGKGCSLLDILEKQVPKKYFLSGEQPEFAGFFIRGTYGGIVYLSGWRERTSCCISGFL